MHTYTHLYATHAESMMVSTNLSTAYILFNAMGSTPIRIYLAICWMQQLYTHIEIFVLIFCIIPIQDI